MHVNPVLPGSKFGKTLGFSAQLFDGYLWVNRDDIYISVIKSLEPGKGNFRNLLDNLLATGKIIKVPTPSDKMREILADYNFIETTVRDPLFGTVRLMVSPEMCHA